VELLKYLLEGYNWVLVLVALTSGGLLVWPVISGRAGGTGVSTLEATQLINTRNAVLLDVRDAAEFATGSILGAKNIPLADLESRIAEVGKNKTVAVVAVCAMGSRAAKAATLLRAQGYAEAVSLTGGIKAWVDAGLPLKRSNDAKALA
jgi:rhodanese-related sulfurtransferase